MEGTVRVFATSQDARTGQPTARSHTVPYGEVRQPQADPQRVWRKWVRHNQGLFTGACPSREPVRPSLTRFVLPGSARLRGGPYPHVEDRLGTVLLDVEENLQPPPAWIARVALAHSPVMQ